MRDRDELPSLDEQLHVWGSKLAGLAEQLNRAVTESERRRIAEDMDRVQEHTARLRKLWLRE
jgi:hypothetical protein